MRWKLSLCFILVSTFSFGQFPQPNSTADIYHKLLKLKENTRVLYIAAHPDDENTRLISYMENALYCRVAYLSLTRGDGGQNLIGTEIGDGVGLLRTQELLQARRIDGGEQFFTRAVDFGYSKSAEESLDKWGEEAILSDVVWIIRHYKPEVIITRFPPTSDAGHGHHESSALLAAKAFDLAGDPKAFPNQLKSVTTWQPSRMYFNASSWWDRTIGERALNNPDYAVIEAGDHAPLLGESYSQIAARSRSQHRSQGFGSDYPYGLQQEYLQYLKGSRIDLGKALHTGLTNDWKDQGMAEIGSQIDEILHAFSFENPTGSVSSLVQLASSLRRLAPSEAISKKLEDVHQIIMACCGSNIQFTTDQQYASPGQAIKVELIAVNPQVTDVNLEKVTIGNEAFSIDSVLNRNILFKKEFTIAIPSNSSFSNPYWLNNPYTSVYNFESSKWLKFAENPASVQALVSIEIEDYRFDLPFGLQYKYVDPAKQVIFAPLYVVPQITASFDQSVLINTPEDSKQVTVELTNRGADFDGELIVSAPKGWVAQPSKLRIQIPAAGRSAQTIEMSRSLDAENGQTLLLLETAGKIDTLQHLQEIVYDHIPSQIILNKAELTCSAIEMSRGGVVHIGYIEGSGDLVPQALEAAGYRVSILKPADLQSPEILKRFDAIITGIRAYNTRDDLPAANPVLSEFVRQGGTWIVQYNTSRSLKSDEIGPFPFTLSRDRVTEEDAPAEFLNPKHPVFNKPNKLNSADFDNWVQERGLYFAETWDPAFTPLIGWKDRSENQLTGALIVAPYGDGYFAYTGISFFRQLPAGVPGAYRLLANMLAMSKHDSKASDE